MYKSVGWAHLWVKRERGGHQQGTKGVEEQIFVLLIVSDRSPANMSLSRSGDSL